MKVKNVIGVFVLLGATALLAGGIKSSKKSDEKKTTNTPSADNKSAAISSSCNSWMGQICQEVGPTSPTCTSVKAVSKLMGDESCKAALKDIAQAKTAIAAMKKVCTEFADKLCEEIGEKSEFCGMVRKRTPSLPPEKCAEMMEPKKFAQVVGQAKRQEMMKKPLSPEKTKLIAAGDVAAFGPKDAPVTIVEFSDFECSYCSRAAGVVKKIKERFPKQVRFVFRHFPLSFHKKAHLASQASLAAKAQGKFWEYHDILFQNQKALGRQELEKYAEQLQLDMKQFKADLDSGKYKAQVDADLKLGGEVFVSGTPSMFINGKRAQNWQDMNALAKQVAAAAAGK